MSRSVKDPDLQGLRRLRWHQQHGGVIARVDRRSDSGRRQHDARFGPGVAEAEQLCARRVSAVAQERHAGPGSGGGKPHGPIGPGVTTGGSERSPGQIGPGQRRGGAWALFLPHDADPGGRAHRLGLAVQRSRDR